MNEVSNIDNLRDLLRFVPVNIRNKLSTALCGHEENLQEIVLRCEKPVCVYVKNEEMYLTQNGCLTYSIDSQPLVSATYKDVTDCFNISCGYSVYSRLNEIKEGFITLSGGHRIGISGTAVVSNGVIVNIRDISTISIRFARQVLGCGEKIAETLSTGNEGLLLCGSPCSGKTTVLRDIARLLSEKYKYRVTVVDSRGELSATVAGVQQMKLGLCDVMNGYPRAQGIQQALRVMSPQFIICDELGTSEDIDAVISGINSGVRFVSTMHASCKNELIRRNNAELLLKTKAFHDIVFLMGRDHPGEVSCSYKIGEIIDV